MHGSKSSTCSCKELEQFEPHVQVASFDLLGSLEQREPARAAVHALEKELSPV